MGSFLDFLGISRLEQEDMKWKFKADLQSNDDKHPFLVENYGEVKSLGAIAFYGVGPGGESTVCGRFQVEVVNTPEGEGWSGHICIVKSLAQPTILSYTTKMLELKVGMSVGGGTLRVVRLSVVLALSVGFKWQ